nr:integrin alpha V [Halisarca dujardinii]
MATRIVLLLCFAAVLFPTSFVFGVTLDELEIIVREPPVNQAGDTRDLFGYSAVPHNLVDPKAPGTTFSAIIGNGRILVGVPNGTVFNGQVSNTGYVLQCPLSTRECSPLTGSGTNAELLYDTTGNAGKYDKEGQFLGVTMKSSGNQFVVCGHRLVYDSSQHGECLLSDRSLENFERILPCSRVGTYSDVLTFNENTFTYCASGSAVDFLGDGKVVIGAPGTGSQRGAGFVYTSEMSRVPVTQLLPSVYGYGGRSVASVNVSGSQTEEYLIGAPRGGDYRGQIHLYSYMVTGNGNAPLLAGPATTITGTKFGSYFGVSVAGVDFNGDGFQDVLVGAPLYFTSAISPETGAVYVYENQVNQNAGSLDSSAVFILEPPNSGAAYGRFGHAIEAMGDLNADGFNDVAISAPFGEGQSGTVYIYLGSQQGMMRTPSQTILGSSLHLMPGLLTNLTSFGSSLSAGDIDGNGYNDLVIGAFESRQVFVLRSRSVATVTVSVTPSSSSYTIKAVKFCESDNSVNDCFLVTYCMTISGKGFSNGQDFTVGYSFYADLRQTGTQARAIFAGTSVSQISQTTVLRVGDQPNCFNYTVHVPASSLSIEEQTSVPIRPSMDVSIDQGTAPSLGDGQPTASNLKETRIYAKVEGTTATSVQGTVECGGGNSVCVSDMELSGFTVQYISRTDSSFQDSLLLVGVVSDLIFSANLYNNGPDPGYGSTVIFTHPAALIFSRVESGPQLTCSTDNTRTTCSIVGLRAQNSTLPISVRFVVLSGTVTGNEGNLSIAIESQIAGEDPVPANNMYTYTIPVQSSIAAKVTGAISNDQLTVLTNYSRTGLPRSLSELGRRVQVNFTVSNAGPSSIGQGRLTIRIPTRNPCTGNAYLFYLASVASSGLQNGVCSVSPADSVNTLGLVLPGSSVVGEGSNSTTTTAPPTSATGVTSLPDIPGQCPSGGSDNTVYVKCSAGSQGCVTVVCEIRSQRGGYNGQLNLLGYLDEHYFQSVTTHYNLQVDAEYEVLDESFSEQDTSDNSFQVSLLLFNSNAPIEQRPVEAWVIVVPIVIALLVVGVVVALLWVGGFFKRKRNKKNSEDQEETDKPQQQENNEKSGDAVGYSFYADLRQTGTQARAIFAGTSVSQISQTTVLRVGDQPNCFNYTVHVPASSLSIEEQTSVPIRPSMDVSIDQGTAPSLGDGQPTASNLKETKIYAKIEGTTATSVQGTVECGDGSSVCVSDMELSGFTVQYV